MPVSQSSPVEYCPIKVVVTSSGPSTSCQPDATGFVTAELIGAQLPDDRDVEMYFLGPKPFMVSMFKIARELGVPQTQVHYEFFGPTEELAC